MSKRRELARELRLIRDTDEKLGGGAVWLAWKHRCHDCSLLERQIADLGFEAEIESARSVPGARLRIFRFRVAALHNAMRHHAVECGPDIEALARHSMNFRTSFGDWSG